MPNKYTNYNINIVDELTNKWSKEKTKVVLDLVGFLNNDSMAANNVKSLENIMENIDKDNQETLKKN